MFTVSQRQKRVLDLRRCSSCHSRRLLKGHNYGILLRWSGDDGDASPGYIRRRGAGGEPYLAACVRLCTMHFRVSSRNWPCQLRERSFSPSSSFNCEKPVSLIQRWL